MGQSTLQSFWSAREARLLQTDTAPFHLWDNIRHIQSGADRKIGPESQTIDAPAPVCLEEQPG